MAIYFSLLVGAIAALLALPALAPKLWERSRGVLIAAPSVLLALLLAAALTDAVQGERLGSLRLTLNSLSSAGGLQRSASIGGDAAGDAIVLRGLAPRSLVIKGERDGVRLLPVRMDSYEWGIEEPRKGWRRVPSDGHLVRQGEAVRLGVFQLPRQPERRVDPIQSFRRTSAFGLKVGEVGAFQLSFERREVRQIFVGKLQQVLSQLPAEAQGRLALTISGETPQSTARSGSAAVNFTVLGREVQDALATRILISKRAADTFGVAGPSGRALYEYGATFTTGQRWKASLTFERLDLHWRAYALVTWLPFLALGAALLGTWNLRRSSYAAFIIFSIAELLLVLRLLIAMGAAYAGVWQERGYLSASEEVQNSVRDALAAICTIPFLLSLTFTALPNSVDETARRALGVFSIAALAAIAAAGGLGRSGQVCLGGAFAALFYLFASPTIRRHVAQTTLRAWSTISAWLTQPRSVRQLGAWLAAVLRTWWGPLILLAMLRLALAGVGVKDALWDRPRIATSLVFLPLLLLAGALSFVRLQRHLQTIAAAPWRAALSWLAWWASLALAFVWTLVANDTGFAFVHIWPFLLLGLLGATLGAARSWQERAVLSFPAVVLVSALLILHGLAALGPGAGRIDRLSAASPAEAADLLGDFAVSKEVLRLLRIAQPSLASSAGTRDAEELDEVFDHLDAYAATRFGRGFIPKEAATTVAPYQLNDNLSAVHLMSPFGLMGAASFVLALLSAMAALTWRAAEAPHDRLWSASTVTGLLAIWTLGLASVYMILANLQITPFTGRNVYMLAGASVGDLLEGVILLALALALLASAEEPSS